MRAVWNYPVLALVALGVIGIPNPARAQNAATHSDQDNNFLELTIYGGYSDYQRTPAGLGGKISPAPILGGRVTENVWNYIGLEQDVNVYSWNKYGFLSNPADGAVLAPPFPIHTVQPLSMLYSISLRATTNFGRSLAWVLARPSTYWARMRRVGPIRCPPTSGSASSGTTSTSKPITAAESSTRRTNGLASASMSEAWLEMAPQFGLSSGNPATTGSTYPTPNPNGIQATAG